MDTHPRTERNAPLPPPSLKYNNTQEGRPKSQNNESEEHKPPTTKRKQYNKNWQKKLKNEI